MKKLLLSAPVLAAASAFASEGGSDPAAGITQAQVEGITGDLVTVGGYVAGAIGGIVAVAAGLRLVIKGINRAVGK